MGITFYCEDTYQALYLLIPMLTISKCQNGSSMRCILFSSPRHSVAYLTFTPTQTEVTTPQQSWGRKCLVNIVSYLETDLFTMPLPHSTSLWITAFSLGFPLVSQARLLVFNCLTHCTPQVTLGVLAVGSFNERLSQPKGCERNEVNFRNGTIGVWALNLITY